MTAQVQASTESWWMTSFSRQFSVPVKREAYSLGQSSHIAVSEIAARVLFLTSTPLLVTTATIDLGLGTLGAMGAIVTLGQWEPVIRFSQNHFNTGRLVLGYVYNSLLGALNPRALADPLLKDFTFPCWTFRVLRIAYSRWAAQWHDDWDEWVVKHVVSRGSHLFEPLVVTVCCLAEGILGSLSATCSLVTFGKFAYLNTLASYNLDGSGEIVQGIAFSILKFINPGAELSKLRLEYVSEKRYVSLGAVATIVALSSETEARPTGLHTQN